MDVIPLVSHLRVQESLTDIEFSHEEIRKILCNVSENSSPGPDLLHPILSKNWTPHVVKLMKISVTTEVAYVTSIYKKSDKRTSICEVKTNQFNWRDVLVYGTNICKQGTLVPRIQ